MIGWERVAILSFQDRASSLSLNPLPRLGSVDATFLRRSLRPLIVNASSSGGSRLGRDRVRSLERSNDSIFYRHLWGIIVGMKKFCEKVSSHWLRHSHATCAIENGCDLHLLQQSLGHSSLAITGKYLHARPNQSSSQFVSLG